MNEVFEKILERLEDELTSIKTKCYTNVDFDKGIYKAQKIVQEVAEEYNGGWIACSGCKDCKNKECEHYGKV